MTTIEQAIEKLETLELGKPYTLVVGGEIGFVSYLFVTLLGVQKTKYAQYNSAVKVIFKEKRKHKVRGLYLYSAKEFAIFPGHIKEEQKISMFGEPVVTEHGTTVSRAKHSMFSGKWMSEAIAKVGTSPVVEHLEVKF